MVLNRRSLERSFSPLSKWRKSSYHGRRPSCTPAKKFSAASESASKNSSNVKVVVRVRPINAKESGENYRSVIDVVDEKVLIFDPKVEENSFFYHGVKQNCRDLLKKQNKDTTYMFDRVFGFDANNEEIFAASTKDLIKTLLDGYNCSVFVYGATGAGKTFTMLGNSDNPGITYLTMAELYNQIDQLKSEKNFELCVSYLEVYNENVRDLLQPSGPLHLREDGKAGIRVAGLKMEVIDNADKLFSLLAQGNKNRTQHPTDANSESSRSHAVFQVHIRMTNILSNQMSYVKLSMVDLAGSERGSATGCKGMRFTEGANINKSLLALGNCINSLADGQKHIPYRDSKLTRLLKDSLGGNCHTVMIANISPSSKSFEDTQNTLKYATRAMKIKSKVKSNVVNCEMHISQYAKLVEELNRKIALQKNEITELKEKLASQTANSDHLVTTQDNDEVHKWKKELKSKYDTKKDLHHTILLTETKRKLLKWREHSKEKAAERLRVLCFDPCLLKQGLSRVESSLRQFKAQAESLSSSLKDCQRKKQLHDVELDIMLERAKQDGYMKYLEEEMLINQLTIEKEDAYMKIVYLQKLIAVQQNEMESHYSIFNTICNLMKDYYLMLKGDGRETNTMKENYQKAVRMMEGVKGISWEDTQNEQILDLKVLMRLSAALSESSSNGSETQHMSHEETTVENACNILSTSLDLLSNKTVGNDDIKGKNSASPFTKDEDDSVNLMPKQHSTNFLHPCDEGISFTPKSCDLDTAFCSSYIENSIVEEVEQSCASKNCHRTVNCKSKFNFSPSILSHQDEKTEKNTYSPNLNTTFSCSDTESPKLKENEHQYSDSPRILDQKFEESQDSTSGSTLNITFTCSDTESPLAKDSFLLMTSQDMISEIKEPSLLNKINDKDLSSEAGSSYSYSDEKVAQTTLTSPGLNVTIHYSKLPPLETNKMRGLIDCKGNTFPSKKLEESKLSLLKPPNIQKKKLKTVKLQGTSGTELNKTFQFVYKKSPSPSAGVKKIPLYKKTSPSMLIKGPVKLPNSSNSVNKKQLQNKENSYMPPPKLIGTKELKKVSKAPRTQQGILTPVNKTPLFTLSGNQILQLKGTTSSSKHRSILSAPPSLRLRPSPEVPSLHKKVPARPLSS